MKKFLAFYVLNFSWLLLAGCATTEPPKPEPQVLVPPVTKVNIPDSLLLKCPQIPRLEARTYTQKELVAAVNNIVDISEACRSKQAILVDTVRKSFNIPAPNATQNTQNVK